MKGKVSAFYGAEIVDDNGQLICTLADKFPVEVIEPFGKPANRDGEWTKIAADGITTGGWVLSSQVHANYHGGAREGAGRKSVGGVPVTAILSPELAEKAAALGNGNASAGIRIALEQA